MARTILETQGEDIKIGGNFNVFGTATGGEEVTILTGSHVFLDPSFNTGGDVLRLPGEAEQYTARTQGSYVILESIINDLIVEIPVSPAGITIIFGGDDSRVLIFDTVDNRVELDGQPIDSTPDPLAPGDDPPQVATTSLDVDGDCDPTTPHLVDASVGNVPFIDDVNIANLVTITNVGSGDTLTFNTPTGTVTFSNALGDLVVTVNEGGVISSITLQGAVDPGAVVVDETTAEIALGFDFFQFG